MVDEYKMLVATSSRVQVRNLRNLCEHSALLPRDSLVALGIGGKKSSRSFILKLSARSVKVA